MTHAAAPAEPHQVREASRAPSTLKASIVEQRVSPFAAMSLLIRLAPMLWLHWLPPAWCRGEGGRGFAVMSAKSSSGTGSHSRVTLALHRYLRGHVCDELRAVGLEAADVARGVREQHQPRELALQPQIRHVVLRLAPKLWEHWLLHTHLGPEVRQVARCR